MNESTTFGDYGGKVLRPFKGAGTNYKSGDQLSAEDVGSWPLQNRIALSNVGKVQWYGEPATIDKEIEKSLKKSKKAKKPAAKRSRKRSRKVKKED